MDATGAKNKERAYFAFSFAVCFVCLCIVDFIFVYFISKLTAVSLSFYFLPLVPSAAHTQPPSPPPSKKYAG